MDFEQARFNMIEQQIRTWEVLDQRVLDLLGVVKREDFVPRGFRELAFADLQIPLGHGQAMLSPKLEARMIQVLDLRPGDDVLEVGTGTGYMTALLARLAHHVDSVEIVPELAAGAASRLAAHGITNLALDVGDAARGWNRRATYDAIVLTGSTPLLPPAFQRDLKSGGRLLAIVGDPPVMTARLITRVGENAFRSDDLFETRIPPLKNALQPERFVF